MTNGYTEYCEWVKPDFSNLGQARKDATWNWDWATFFFLFNVVEEQGKITVYLFGLCREGFECKPASKSNKKPFFKSEIDAWESAWEEYNYCRYYLENDAIDLFEKIYSTIKSII